MKRFTIVERGSCTGFIEHTIIVEGNSDDDYSSFQSIEEDEFYTPEILCDNCSEDISYIVEDNLYEYLDIYKSKEAVKKFLDEEFDFSVNQACGTCYFTKWFQTDEEKQLWYNALEKIDE